MTGRRDAMGGWEVRAGEKLPSSLFAAFAGDWP